MRMKFRFSRLLALAVMGGVLIGILSSLSAEFGRAIRMIFGLLLVLFLPGYSLSYLIWAPNRLATFERVIIALVISLPLIGLVVLAIVRLGAPFTLTTTLTAAIALTLMIILYYKSIHLRVR